MPRESNDLESDPVESGFFATLARPGGKVTGQFLDAPELMGKWLELLKRGAPRCQGATVREGGRISVLGIVSAARRSILVRANHVIE